jgi:hypothetical protein
MDSLLPSGRVRLTPILPSFLCKVFTLTRAEEIGIEVSIKMLIVVIAGVVVQNSRFLYAQIEYEYKKY